MRTVDPVKHQAKRRQIADAAAGLFATKGFDGTTTAEICAAAGMSSGNLFHYFANKREIFAAIFEEDGEDRAALFATAQTTQDPFASLLEVVTFLAASAAEPLVPNLVLEAMLQAYRDPALAELLGRNEDEEQATIAALLVKAQEAGQIDPELDPADTASWIVALIGALYLQAATDDHFDPAKQLPTLRVIVERFLRPGVWKTAHATNGYS